MSYPELEADLVAHLLTFQINLKLFHFQTPSYGRHKAADWLGGVFADQLDQLMEAAQGKYGRIPPLETKLTLASKMDEMIGGYTNELLVYLDSVSQALSKSDPVANSDLITIIDQMKVDLNKFIYLISFE